MQNEQITQTVQSEIPVSPMIILESTKDSFISFTSEPELFVYDNKGTISIMDEKSNEHIIGAYAIKTVDVVSARENEFSLFEVLDASTDTLEYCDLLGDDPYEFSEQLVNTLHGKFHWYIDPEINIDSFLILDKLAIDPKYRGTGIGLVALDAIIRRFRLGTGFVVMFPYPLQYIDYSNKDDPNCEVTKLEEQWSKPTKPSTNVDADSQKLQAYYARLGFVPVAGTKLMVRPPYLQIE